MSLNLAHYGVGESVRLDRSRSRGKTERELVLRESEATYAQTNPVWTSKPMLITGASLPGALTTANSRSVGPLLSMYVIRSE
jgi:hypothetical protein